MATKRLQLMQTNDGRLLTEEVSARLARNYKENVATNDLIEPQALQMADVMTRGVVQQFPQAFMG